jgi:cytochrome c oxidase subunit 2
LPCRPSVIRTPSLAPIGGTAVLLGGCAGAQSALDPAGPEARAVAGLFWVMTAAGAAIWLAVVLAYLYAKRRDRRVWSGEAAGRLVLWAGAVFPASVLFMLLGYALWLMPGLRPWTSPQGPGLVVEVTGHQYWWDVVYRPEHGPPVVTANALRLPVGTPVEFRLASPDVIHSFWIPALGGKMDLIPGRTNRLLLTADRPGSWRGACAEFCGSSHALMAFDVAADPPESFDAWLAAEAAPSPGADAPGRDAFLAEGCGACHTVRGTEADGRVGPDLSHVGSRLTIGAGTLPRSPETLARFITDPAAVKPGAGMPAYEMLAPARIDEIARWLEGLK